jgi:CheY-like chemotaxis protein
MLHQPEALAMLLRIRRRRSRSIDSAVILVVDDEDDLRAFTVSLLRAHGYGVLEAQHGEAAIESLCKHAPDLVVLDLNMPIMDGREFCVAQQKLPDPQLAGVPVLLVTGAEGDTSRDAEDMNAVGLVRKPFEPDQLLTAIHTALQPR